MSRHSLATLLALLALAAPGTSLAYERQWRLSFDAAGAYRRFSGDPGRALPDFTQHGFGAQGMLSLRYDFADFASVLVQGRLGRYSLSAVEEAPKDWAWVPTVPATTAWSKGAALGLALGFQGHRKRAEAAMLFGVASTRTPAFAIDGDFLTWGEAGYLIWDLEGAYLFVPARDFEIGPVLRLQLEFVERRHIAILPVLGLRMSYVFGR